MSPLCGRSCRGGSDCKDTSLYSHKTSAHTISSYRDTFRLLLKFLERRVRKPPSRLQFDDLQMPLIVEFLDELETSRKISARSRNLRLTAIRSFFRYAAFELPTHAAQIQRVLAIPGKRYPKTLVNYLLREEAEALLNAPDLESWSGRRDCALILLALQTGLRLSELITLKRGDLFLNAGAHVRVMGKGRKERCTPLAKRTVAVLKQWSKEPNRGTNDLVFTNARGGQLSPDGVQYIFANQVATASRCCPTLVSKRGHATCLSPHRCDGTASSRSRPYRDCFMAGARIHRNHADLFGCKFRNEGGSPSKSLSIRQESYTIQTRR
jgi:site-specific recombinase XerD